MESSALFHSIRLTINITTLREIPFEQKEKPGYI